MVLFPKIIFHLPKMYLAVKAQLIHLFYWTIQDTPSITDVPSLHTIQLGTRIGTQLVFVWNKVLRKTESQRGKECHDRLVVSAYEPRQKQKDLNIIYYWVPGYWFYIISCLTYLTIPITHSVKEHVVTWLLKVGKVLISSSSPLLYSSPRPKDPSDLGSSSPF